MRKGGSHKQGYRGTQPWLTKNKAGSNRHWQEPDLLRHTNWILCEVGEQLLQLDQLMEDLVKRDTMENGEAISKT